MHIGEFSIYLKIRDGSALKEHAVSGNYIEGNSKVDLSCTIINIKPDTGFQIILKLRKGFDCSKSEGIRVAIALGPKKPRSFFPAKAQYWWIPFASLAGSEEPQIIWNEHWNWKNDATAESSDGRKPPSPRPFDSGDSQNLYNCEWPGLTKAPEGCIAVYVACGTAPPATLKVGKGPALYVKIDSVISHSDWFRATLPKDDTIHAFEFRNMDPNANVILGEDPSSNATGDSSKDDETIHAMWTDSKPQVEDSSDISTRAIAPARRSSRVAGSTRTDYNLKRRYRKVTPKPKSPSTNRTAKSTGKGSVLSTDVRENSTPEFPAAVERNGSAEETFLPSESAAEQQAPYGVAGSVVVHHNALRATSPVVVPVARQSLSAVTKNNSEGPAQVVATSNPSATDISLGAPVQDNQRDLRRARQEYELFKAQNRLNERKMAMELEERFASFWEARKNQVLPGLFIFTLNASYIQPASEIHHTTQHFLKNAIKMHHRDGFEVVLKHDDCSFAELGTDGQRDNDRIFTAQHCQTSVRHKRHAYMRVQCNILPDFDFLAGNAVRIRLIIDDVYVRASNKIETYSTMILTKLNFWIGASIQTRALRAHNLTSAQAQISAKNPVPGSPAAQTTATGSSPMDVASADLDTGATAGVRVHDGGSNREEQETGGENNIQETKLKSEGAQKSDIKSEVDARRGGANLLGHLRKRLAENNQRLGHSTAPTQYRTAAYFQDKTAKHFTNIVRYRDTINRQIDLHRLLCSSAGTHFANRVRQASQAWHFNDIDVYERELDVSYDAFSTILRVMDGLPGDLDSDHHKTRSHQSYLSLDSPETEGITRSANAMPPQLPLPPKYNSEKPVIGLTDLPISPQATVLPNLPGMPGDFDTPAEPTGKTAPASSKRKAAESVEHDLSSSDDDEEIRDLELRLLRSEAQKESLDLEMQLRARKKAKMS
ncbi:hypothetical protein Q7P37_010856 [Cladosporium fusiforme]